MTPAADAIRTLSRLSFVQGCRVHVRPLPPWLECMAAEAIGLLTARLIAFLEDRCAEIDVVDATENAKQALRLIEERDRVAA